jgi:hypothetical protein
MPEWRVPSANHREPAPLEGYVVSFVAFHERGLGMPPSQFMWAILHYYGVELHHLAPQLCLVGRHFRGRLRGVLGDGAPLEVVAPPLQGGALHQEGR